MVAKTVRNRIQGAPHELGRHHSCLVLSDQPWIIKTKNCLGDGNYDDRRNAFPLFTRFQKQSGLLVIILVFVLIIAGLGLSNFANIFSSSFDTSRSALEDEANLSVYVEKGMKYYFDQFFHTNFMGIGWVSSVTSTHDDAILMANIAGMKLVDLGIFEVLFGYRLLRLLVYLRFLWVALRQAEFIIGMGMQGHVSLP